MGIRSQTASGAISSLQPTHSNCGSLSTATGFPEPTMGEVELAGIGVDGWGVDYALLGENGELLENPYHYRDQRTDGVMEEVFRLVTREEVYQSTGIQFMPFNTLYQLLAALRRTPGIISKTSTDDSGFVPLVADRHCGLRIHQRNYHPDGGPGEAPVGRRPDGAPGPSCSTACDPRGTGFDPGHAPS
jgi:FGGY family of carbohydrate kinases, N-terminal domain